MTNRCLESAGEAKLIVSVRRSSSARVSPVQTSGVTRAGLVMDGHCQDEFLHCTNPGSDQERIFVTFRWVEQHVASCSFLKIGVACCLPTCARGLSFTDTELVGKFFFGFLASPQCLVHLGGDSSASHPPCVYKTWVSKMCLLLGGQWGYYLRYPLGSLLGSTKYCQSNW